MPSGRSTAAREIAEQMDTKYGITQPSFLTPLIVQIFMVLTKPIREALYAYLQVQKAALNTAKAKLVRNALKADGLAEQLSVLQTTTAAAFQPITQFLQYLPLDTIIHEIPFAEEFVHKDAPKVDIFNTLADISPDFAEFLKSLADALPVKIPLSAISSMFGENFEFFEGIENFQDLREKVEELEFRLARTVAVSSYAQAGSSYIDIQLRNIDVYMDVLVTLNTGAL
jgi:hypothetical protein